MTIELIARGASAGASTGCSAASRAMSPMKCARAPSNWIRSGSSAWTTRGMANVAPVPRQGRREQREAVGHRCDVVVDEADEVGAERTKPGLARRPRPLVLRQGDDPYLRKSVSHQVQAAVG